jgi:uncharacterized protein YdiU (UPF0061 family)
MTDEQLVRRFEGGDLPADQFSHVEHVRVAWWYLHQHPFAEALAAFTTALRRFATAHGAAQKYHETMTVAYMMLIAERLDAARDLPWPAFAGRFPDLFAKQPSVLARYYRDETLKSDRARRVCVMPDRAA